MEIIEEIKYRKFLAENLDAQIIELQMCKKSFWHWCSNWVLTMDEHDKVNPYKNFPQKEYLKKLAEVFEKYNNILIPKSRQMMVTWFCVVYFLWRAQFFPAQRIFLQSKKGKDANALVERAKGVFLRQPAWMKQQHEYIKSPNASIKFPGINSIIEGVPQGPDQIRSYTLSGWFCDEAAFQNELVDAWTAVAPTLDSKTCKTVMISSANPGFFEALVKDEAGGENEGD